MTPGITASDEWTAGLRWAAFIVDGDGAIRHAECFSCGIGQGGNERGSRRWRLPDSGWREREFSYRLLITPLFA